MPPPLEFAPTLTIASDTNVPSLLRPDPAGEVRPRNSCRQALHGILTAALAIIDDEDGGQATS
jgi:hypothetical protein